jgi:hypothetical protein
MVILIFGLIFKRAGVETPAVSASVQQIIQLDIFSTSTG